MTTSIRRLDLNDKQHDWLMWALGFATGRLHERKTPDAEARAAMLIELSAVVSAAPDVSVERIEAEDILLNKSLPDFKPLPPGWTPRES